MSSVPVPAESRTGGTSCAAVRWATQWGGAGAGRVGERRALLRGRQVGDEVGRRSARGDAGGSGRKDESDGRDGKRDSPQQGTFTSTKLNERTERTFVVL